MIVVNGVITAFSTTYAKQKWQRDVHKWLNYNCIYLFCRVKLSEGRKRLLSSVLLQFYISSDVIAVDA